MIKELQDFFISKGFEIEEKKTVIQILIQNLLAFSVHEKKNGVFDITINMLKDDEEKEKLKKQIQDLDIDIVFERSVPEIKNTDVKSFIAFTKKSKVIAQIKRLSEFREVQSEFTLSECQKDGKTLKWRSNLPTEKSIVDSVFRCSEYTRRKAGLGGLKLSKDDVVLDLGGNIGAFTCDIFDKVKQVITFEPEDVNFEFLSTNCAENKCENVILYKKAVVGNDDKVRDFYLGKVPYYYSFLVKHNRKRVPVECININDVIKQYNPTKMKVDIEGSEWEVLTSCTDFGRVDQIIFEYNFDMNQDLKSGFKRFKILTEHLRKHKFDVRELERDMKQNWNLVFLVNKL
jgi:FkbM family methyltransferase